MKTEKLGWNELRFVQVQS